MAYGDVIENVMIGHELIVFEQCPERIIQSKKYRSGITKFLIKINENLHFDTYQTGTPSSTKTLPKSKKLF